MVSGDIVFLEAIFLDPYKLIAQKQRKIKTVKVMGVIDIIIFTVSKKIVFFDILFQIN